MGRGWAGFPASAGGSASLPADLQFADVVPVDGPVRVAVGIFRADGAIREDCQRRTAQVEANRSIPHLHYADEPGTPVDVQMREPVVKSTREDPESVAVVEDGGVPRCSGGASSGVFRPLPPNRTGSFAASWRMPPFPRRCGTPRRTAGPLSPWRQRRRGRPGRSSTRRTPGRRFRPSAWARRERVRSKFPSRIRYPRDPRERPSPKRSFPKRCPALCVESGSRLTSPRSDSPFRSRTRRNRRTPSPCRAQRREG